MGLFDTIKGYGSAALQLFQRPKDKSIDTLDGFAVPQVLTFPSLFQTWSHTYLLDRSDEAMKRDRRKALAMYRDGWIQSLLSERYESVLSLPWHIEPDDDKDPVQLAVAQGITRSLASTHRFRQMIRTLLRAIWFGKYGLNLKWEWAVMPLPVPEWRPLSVPPRNEMCRILRIKKHGPVHGDKITFTWDGTPVVAINAAEVEKIKVRNKNIVTIPDRGYGLEMSGNLREMIVVHKHDPEDADYWEPESAGTVNGVGLRSRVFWIDAMRRDFLSWVMDSLERVGAGVPIVKYAMGSSEAKSKAEEIARKLNRRSVITIPVANDSRLSGGGVELLEGPTNAVQVIQQNLIMWIEGQIERLFVGQSMSGGADIDNGLGGNGRAEFARDTKLQKIMADADELEETLTGTDDEPGPVHTIKKYTYPWARSFRCRFKIGNRDHNGLQRVQAGLSLASAGVAISEDELREAGGFSAPTDDDHVVGGNPNQRAESDAKSDEGRGRRERNPSRSRSESAVTDEDFGSLFGDPSGEGDELTDDELGRVTR